MTKDAQVFNLLEGILSMVNGIRFFEPDDVLALMPASVFLLYEFWRSAKPTIFAWRLTIKSRPPIRFAVWSNLAGYESTMNLCVVMRWLNGSRVLFEPALARRLFKLAFVLGSGEATTILTPGETVGSDARPTIITEKMFVWPMD